MSKSSLYLLYRYYYCISFVAIIAVFQTSFLFSSEQQRQKKIAAGAVKSNKGPIVFVAAKILSPHSIQHRYRHHHHHHHRYPHIKFNHVCRSLRGGADRRDGYGTNESSRRKRRNTPPPRETRPSTQQRGRGGRYRSWNQGDVEDDLSSSSMQEEKIISALDDGDDDDSYEDEYRYDDGYYDGYYDDGDDNDDNSDDFIFGSRSSDDEYCGKQRKIHRHTRTTAPAPDLNGISTVRHSYRHNDKGMLPKFTDRRRSEVDADPSGERRRSRDNSHLHPRKRNHNNIGRYNGRVTFTDTHLSNQQQRQRQHEVEEDLYRQHRQPDRSKEFWTTEESFQQRKRSILNGRRGDNIDDGISIGNSTNQQSGRRRQPSSTIRQEPPMQQQRRQQNQWQRKQYTRQSTNASSSTTLPPPPPWRTASTTGLHHSRVNKEEKVGAVSTSTSATIMAPENMDVTSPNSVRDSGALLPPPLPSHLFGQPQSRQPPQQRRQPIPLRQQQSHVQRTNLPNNAKKTILPSQQYISPTIQTMPTTRAPTTRLPISNPKEGGNEQLGQPRQRSQSRLQQSQQQPLISTSTSTQPLPPAPAPAPKLVQTTMSMTTPWARKFILSRPKDALLPIPRDFLADGFNLVQLAAVVEKVATAAREVDEDNNRNAHKQQLPQLQQQQHVGPNSLYKAALRLILGGGDAAAVVSNSNHKQDRNSTMSSSFTSTQQEKEVQKAAEVLYTLLHARYISSPMGLNTIRRMMSRQQQQQQQNRYSLSSDLGSDSTEAIFGKCPRVSCRGMPLLPYGRSDEYDLQGIRKGMKYCCSCGEIFYVWESKVDGSAWGPEFCHLFIMTHGAEIFPMLSWNKNTKCMTKQQQQVVVVNGEGKEELNGKPIPKIFGFPIHPQAMKYPIF